MSMVVWALNCGHEHMPRYGQAI